MILDGPQIELHRKAEIGHGRGSAGVDREGRKRLHSASVLEFDRTCRKKATKRVRVIQVVVCGGRAAAAAAAAPRKKRLIISALDNFFLQSRKSAMAFSVQEGHVDLEQTHKAICGILEPRCLAARRPFHASCNAELGGIHSAVEHLDFNPSDLAEDLGEGLGALFLAQQAPVGGEEVELGGRNQLLQSPPASEPAAQTQLRVWTLPVVQGGRVHVGQNGVALGGLLVPEIHGVDCLGQLGAAHLIDAARVDPEEVESAADGHGGGALDLGEAPLVGYLLLLLVEGLRDLALHAPHLLQRDLVVAPCVRENGVARDVVVAHIDEFQFSRVEQPHVGEISQSCQQRQHLGQRLL